MPTTDDISDAEPLQGDLSGEYPNKDFKVKQIEDWVSGLQQCAPPLEDITELPEPVHPIVDVNTAIVVTPSVVDHKISPGMEAAKRYISSLTANASATQLANHGLVVILLFECICEFEGAQFVYKRDREDNCRCPSSRTSHVELVKKKYFHYRGIT